MTLSHSVLFKSKVHIPSELQTVSPKSLRSTSEMSGGGIMHASPQTLFRHGSSSKIRQFIKNCNISMDKLVLSTKNLQRKLNHSLFKLPVVGKVSLPHPR